MLTVAPGTAPPFSSVIRPDSAAPTAWACAVPASPPIATKSASTTAPILSAKPCCLPVMLISSSSFARHRIPNTNKFLRGRHHLLRPSTVRSSP